jgi:putative peptidoglycan lipid II flippase
MGAAAEIDDRLKARLFRILLAALAMGGVLLVAQMALRNALDGGGERYLALLGLVLLGMVSYAAIGRSIGALALDEIRASLRRQR